MKVDHNTLSMWSAFIFFFFSFSFRGSYFPQIRECVNTKNLILYEFYSFLPYYLPTYTFLLINEFNVRKTEPYVSHAF